MRQCYMGIGLSGAAALLMRNLSVAFRNLKCRYVPMATMGFELTDVGNLCLQDHCLQGIVWEYNVDKPFRLHGWAAEFLELTCLGMPYRIPLDINGQPTITHSL